MWSATAPLARGLARRSLAARALSCRLASTKVKGGGPGSFGIVLDIDGVLTRGTTPLKGARPVMEYLTASHLESEPSYRIPFILMTNGGGVLEDVKVKEVNDVMFPSLPKPVDVSQLLLSHTPMRALANDYKDKLVMVLGSKDYVHVAKSYGFQKVITIDDYAHWHPELYPFRTFLQKNHNPYGDEPIAAVFILYDPTDWALDIQVLCDILQGGVLADHPHKAQGKQVPVFSSNPDLVFSSTYATPRLAQGSFVSALQHVYSKAYGGPPLQVTQYGKPSAAAYRYAEHMFVHECRRLDVVPGYVPPHKPHPQHNFPLKTIYAVGDNPASDIQGAKAANSLQACKWVSILTRTGVFSGPGNDPKHPADYVVDDVQAALHLILEMEGMLD